MPPTWPAAGSEILRGNVRDHRFGGDEQPGDRAGILQCGPYHLGGIDNAGLDHVDIVFGLGIEALWVRVS